MHITLFKCLFVKNKTKNQQKKSKNHVTIFCFTNLHLFVSLYGKIQCKHINIITRKCGKVQRV